MGQSLPTQQNKGIKQVGKHLKVEVQIMDQNRNSNGRPKNPNGRPVNKNQRPPRRAQGPRPERPPFEKMEGVQARPKTRSEHHRPGQRPAPQEMQGRRPKTAGAVTRPPRTKKQKSKTSKANRAMMIVLDLLIVALFVSSAYFFIWPKWVAKQQMDRRNEILDNLEKGAYSFTIGKDENKVPGESPETFGQEGLNFELDEGPEGDTVNLSYIGRIVISKIQCNTPLAPVTDQYHLRFGCTIWPYSAPLSEPGQTAIFGHRFLTKGRDFNRLDEVHQGDTFYIDDVTTNTRYIYRVDQQVIIKPSELDALISPPNNVASMYGPEDNTVLLITCHPAVYGAKNERLLIYAHVESIETIPE